MLHLYSCKNIRSYYNDKSHYLYNEEDLRQARVLALQQGSSLNAVFREFLKGYIGRTKRYQQVTERIIQQAESSQYHSGGKK